LVPVQEEEVQATVEVPVFELQRSVGNAANGNGQPEVDGPIGQHAGEGLPGGGPEPGDHRDQDELDHTEAPGGDGDGGQDIGQPIGHQQVDGGDEVAEGGDEDPE
jgi:hypothetical protein